MNPVRTAENILTELRSMADPEKTSGMARYGINPDKTLGISIPALRAIARRIGKDHALAEELWSTGVHEARILASFIDLPGQVTSEQMEIWASDFDSWDVCDQCCSNLFDKIPFADQKAIEWSAREEEFVKRAGFVLMATLAVHDKKAGDEKFIGFLPYIVRESDDERNFVKKAVSWALRQIGKRNRRLNALAIGTAREIQQKDSRAARWIASDALRELTGESVQNKFK